jgi:hypothetical protein
MSRSLRDRLAVTGPGEPAKEIPVTRAACRFLILLLALACLTCRPTARSSRSYDQIRDLVAGRTAAEVEHLLGQPDARETFLDESRWAWWNYTFLDGDQYAPEIRGTIVHLEILFRKPTTSGQDPPPSAWKVDGPLAVSYSRPIQGSEGQ